MISDGDSKTHKALCEMKPYGDIPIEKEECCNHVNKRLGTALRNAAREQHLGDAGKLTERKIERLTKYYGRAVRNSIETNAVVMKQNILATLLHCQSTDELPSHQYCPHGTDSWCFYNRALAKQKDSGKHEDFIYTRIPKDIAEKIFPIYLRLSEPGLLN